MANRRSESQLNVKGFSSLIAPSSALVRKLWQPLLASLSVLALVCLAPRSHASSRIFERSYTLAPGSTLLLENVNGSVYIAGWNRDEVEIEAVKSSQSPAFAKAAFDSGPNLLDSVDIEVQNQPRRIAIRTRYPPGEGAEVGVEYHLRVPNRVLLEAVATVNGAVHVRGVSGGGILRSVNGDVEVLDSSGRFSAKTTNGNVHLALRQLSGGAPMSLETVNGSVVLALPANARANLDVTHLNGDFLSELPISSTASPSTSPVFRAKLGEGGAKIFVRTVNGKIRLMREPGPLPL